MAKHLYLQRIVPSAFMGLALLVAGATHAAESGSRQAQARTIQSHPAAAKIVHRQAMRHVAYTPPVAARKASLRPSVPPAITKKASLQSLLRSEAILVQDLETSTVLYDKNGDEMRPIASISKLMTALIVAEANLPMSEMLDIGDEDVDRLRHSRSRLPVGTTLSRADMLHLALMASENRAAHTLGRHYPGGMAAFVRAMNDKARALGMRDTTFVEPTGLSSDNVSTARDLVKLLHAANEHPLIRRYTTDDKYEIALKRGRQLVYNNTNRLVRNANWDISVSKTGFINEAGQCLVMLARIDDRDVAIVLLNASGSQSRIGDAQRIRSLVESNNLLAML
jgi:D-alanyl-D-alanine endopeptidase (penicillin-binding protein 7)